jgi:CheY-like chemotaxis protein
VSSAIVLTAIADLFFAAKVEASLRPYGYTVVKTGTVAEIISAIAAEAPCCLILDLDNGRIDVMEIIAGLKGNPDAPLPILAYTNHSNVQGMRRALDLGADKVVARSELASYLPQLIAGLSAGR